MKEQDPFTIVRIEAVGAGFISGKPRFEVRDSDSGAVHFTGTITQCEDYVDAMADCDINE